VQPRRKLTYEELQSRSGPSSGPNQSGSLGWSYPIGPLTAPPFTPFRQPNWP
jgi:hypothetical protein